MQDALLISFSTRSPMASKGMVRAFADTVRRMVAEALSAQLLNAALFRRHNGKDREDRRAGRVIFRRCVRRSIRRIDRRIIPYAWANGGIMTSDGRSRSTATLAAASPIAATLPCSARVGCLKAYVPLPDGRNISPSHARTGAGAGTKHPESSTPSTCPSSAIPRQRCRRAVDHQRRATQLAFSPPGHRR